MIVEAIENYGLSKRYKENLNKDCQLWKRGGEYGATLAATNAMEVVFRTN